MRKAILVKVVLWCSIGCCLMPASLHAQKNVPQIIFETDMGNDVDDALALDMLYKYQDKRKASLLAIISNKQSAYSTEYIDLMNHWYGYPGIPVGKITGGADSENDAKKYAEYVSRLKDEKGGPLFQRPPFDYQAIPDAVTLYRKILSRQKDHAVTIVSVGFSTNLARLLESAPDHYSRMTGRQLVAKKVKLLSVMAGGFTEKPIAEYNVVKDVSSAQQVAKDWPTQIVYAPFEAGKMVLYPARSIENDFKWTARHPVVEAYKYYLPMPYDRPCWDLLSVLYAVEDSPEFFTKGPWGNVTVDDKGVTHFTRDASGTRACLTLTETQAANTLHHLVELITQQPRNRKQ
ncbi:nucleoside hydrolase [Niabella beijingensis]|uniref:nucleoside hydrolase n=1 Tax=Niabella beijingensis TaxID=2872700 RepID=UPI001CBAB024|nr:nucleoside hydrolase [Niabella beijingensis]MBZ4188879.1 nucleoside hydrolase [Niabella beijingensis]